LHLNGKINVRECSLNEVSIMRKLIINADDFGLHTAVNKGIISGFVGGCITSTSLMPGGDAFLEAVALAKTHPKLGIGVHLMLVGGRATCSSREIPTLIDDNGFLPANYPDFLQRYLSGRVKREDIRRELTAQVQRVITVGLPITHLDSHQHMHVVPGVFEIVLDIAEQFHICALRIPAEPLFFFGNYPFQVSRFIARAGLSVLSTLAAKQAIQRGLRAPGHFFGMLAGGNMQPHYLLTIIDQLPEGVSEIMVHPGTDTSLLRSFYGWDYHWQQELEALTSPLLKERMQEKKIDLVSFRELCDEPII
jgi:chitin disaccharide deacetylase